MKDIKKINDQNVGEIECDKECENNATVAIETNEGKGVMLHLCPKHRRELEEQIKDKIKNNFEGMNREEIAEKMVKDGEGLL